MFEVFNDMTHQYTRTCFEQLKDFIYRKQEAKFDWADEERAKISTVEELKAYNQEMRAKFIEGIGGLIEVDAPLNAEIIRKEDCGEFHMETIMFQSRPGTYVPATMYIPKGIELPAPAILFVCGHSDNGRMYKEYQIVCRTLVKAGFIVFAMDPTGQGERSNFYDPKTGEYLINRTVSDHDGCGVPATATGKFLQSYFLCDEMRAVDYMLTRPEIDPKRIGVTGNSGGGTQTTAMMICDDRIAAAAPGTFVTNRREYMYSGQAQDSEQIWPGITDFGFDHVNAFMIFAPRPAAILATTYDFFPIEGARETLETAKRFYGMYGKEDNVRICEDAYTHCYTAKLAVKATEFFTEVLMGQKITVSNDDIEVFPEEKMYATKSGNIMGEIEDAQNIPDNVRAFAAKLREERMALPEAERKERAKKWLWEKVMKDRTQMPFNARIFPKMHCVQIGEYMGTTVSWWSQKRLFSFGDMLKKLSDNDIESLPTIIAIWTDGTKKIGEHEEWIRAQIEAGKQVLVLDVPGVGGIEQRPMVLNMPYKDRYGTIYRLCCDLMYLGDSMAAMHCYDVLRTIEMLGVEFGVKEEDITIYCEGIDGVYGIMAGFLNEKVHMEYGKDLLLNVEKQLIGQKVFTYDNTLAVVVPGMLKYFEYEDLLR